MTEQNDTDDIVRLTGAQGEIRDAFFAADAGLFVLAADAGTGKSTALERIGAEFLARRHKAGTPAPEASLAAVSFSRDDAADIAPGIAEALDTLARDPQAEIDFTPAEATQLSKQVRRADAVGTVDSVIQSLFQEIALSVGFDESPQVRAATALQPVRTECLTQLRRTDRYAAHLDRLQNAYPGESEYRAGAGELLAAARRACRHRQLSVPEFRQRLADIIEAVYPDGGPDTFADVKAAIERCVTPATADEYDASVTDAERETIVEADAALCRRWQTALDDLCTLLGPYSACYDDLTRPRAVASYQDCAHWVAQFLTADQYAAQFRRRLLERYRARLDVVLVDEAQDVSQVQHAAVAPLIDEETRVLLSGDLKQSIYRWRNAQPDLFRQAIENRKYFNIDWQTHVVRHEHQTHRCRPGIAAALDTVFESVFTDPARGADGTTQAGYEGLEPARTASTAPRVHIAPVSASADPGSQGYVDPPSGDGEADALAQTLANGLADGRFADEADDEPTVTALVATRSNVDTFVDAFERAGLTVRDGTARVFAQPLVRLAVEVAMAFADPEPEQRFVDLARDRLTNALSDSELAGTTLAGVFELFGSDPATVARETDPDRPALTVVHAFHQLATRQPHLSDQSAPRAITTIVDELALLSDPLEVGDDQRQQVAALEQFTEYVGQTLGEDDLSLAEFVDQLVALYANPQAGPDVPVVDAGRYDVIIRTIFQAKGDEADVVALADIGTHIAELGPHADTFVAQGSTLALAPPATEAAAATPALPGFEHGLFDATRTPWDLDAGLRWATQQRVDSGGVAGAKPLVSLAQAHRAERWRLLYVALSRARNHLVVPLPWRCDDVDQRDSWVGTLRTALRFDDSRSAGQTYTHASPDGDRFRIQVADPTAAPSASAADPPVPAIATTNNDGLPPLKLRFIRPSGYHPLLDAPAQRLVRYVQHRPLTPDADTLADALGLIFETVGPETVGDIAHATVAAAIRQRETLTDSMVEGCNGPLASSLERILERSPSMTVAERRSIETFVTDIICPQLAGSEFWQRIQRADEVYIEEPVDTLTRVCGVDTRMQAFADVVLKQRAGFWRAEEIKIVLREDSQSKPRSKLQAQLYAWGLANQLDGATVEAGLTQFGVRRQISKIRWDSQTVLDCLKQSRDLF